METNNDDDDNDDEEDDNDNNRDRDSRNDNKAHCYATKGGRQFVASCLSQSDYCG